MLDGVPRKHLGCLSHITHPCEGCGRIGGVSKIVKEGLSVREKIGLRDSVMELMFKMSEGNPGAMSVLMQILQNSEDVLTILDLDDMNIRGSQIWVGFKDYCGEDIDKFIAAARKRDEKMIEVINKECASSGEIAVRNGASFVR
jgi:hypothetical protein